MNEAVTAKCPKCGDLKPPRFECNITGEEIDVFEYSEDGEIVDKKFMRCLASCDELDFNQDIVVENDPDHSLDFLHSDVDLYIKQIGLEGDADWVNLRIRGRFADGLAYNGYFIGTTFAQCVENLDKAKAGQPYGTPLENWE